MTRRAFSSQCRIITAVILLAVFATFITYPYQSSARTSAKFRYGKDVREVSSAAPSVDISFDYSGNGSHGLVKRVMAPMASISEIFASAARGCQLTDWMLATEDVVFQALGPPAVSKWLQADLYSQSSRWARTLLDGNFDPTSIAPFLIGLNSVDGFSHSNVRVLTTSVWQHSDFRQGDWYRRNPNGLDRPPTWGNYEMITTASGLNKAGVIIILNAWSPAFMSSQDDGPAVPISELPAINIWADVGYLEYARVAGCQPWSDMDDPVLRGPNKPPRHRTPPVWIFIPKLWRPLDSLSIISYCLSDTYGLANLPTWQNKVTFPIGSFCFYAITGTQRGGSLAFMLITHKYRLRQSTLGSVTIWGSGIYGADGYELPSMLFWIVSDTQRSIPGWKTIGEIRQENSAYASQPGNNLRNFPLPLRPV